jgi:hypothetical protein
MDMHVMRAFGCDRGFPPEFAAPGRSIIVAEEQARCTGKRLDATSGTVKRKRIAPGEIGARSPIVWHEERVADEGGVADQIGHRVRRVARRVQGDRVEFADPEALAVSEQPVELASIALEFGASIEDLAEYVLDDADALADAECTAEPLLNVGCGREVVRVDVGLEDPVDLEPLLANEGDELIRRLHRSAAGGGIVIQYGVDNRAVPGRGIPHDIVIRAADIAKSSNLCRTVEGLSRAVAISRPKFAHSVLISRVEGPGRGYLSDVERASRFDVAADPEVSPRISGCGTTRPRRPPASRSAYWGISTFLLFSAYLSRPAAIVQSRAADSIISGSQVRILLHPP